MERGGGGHTDQFAPFRIAEGAPVPPAGRHDRRWRSTVSRTACCVGRAA